MASRHERHASGSSNNNNHRQQEDIYTHPYTTSSTPSRRVHFNEHVDYAEVPEWHVTATSQQAMSSPALVVIPSTNIWTPPPRMLHLDDDDDDEGHMPSLGQAQDKLARPVQIAATMNANQSGSRGSPPRAQTFTPQTPQLPTATHKPRPSQSSPPPPPPQQSHRPTPSPPRPHPQLAPNNNTTPSPPRRVIDMVVNNVNNTTPVNNVNRAPSSQPPPSPPPASLNTLLRPYGGVAVNFIADPSSTTVTVTDQTASPSAHYSPPRGANTRNIGAPNTVPLKPYQREQHATSPPLTTMRIVLPPAIAVHHHVANYGTPNGNVGNAGGPMIVVVSSRIPGALLTVGELLDVLRAVLMTQITPLEWDRASTADRTTATEAFYARISQSPDQDREKSFGVRKVDWCGRDSWFGGLELVGEEDDAVLGRHPDSTWKLVMRAGP